MHQHFLIFSTATERQARLLCCIRKDLVLSERRQLQAAKWKVVYNRVFCVDQICENNFAFILCVFMVELNSASVL